MMTTDLLCDRQFMRRCLDLAALGMGKTAPNPMVGAVLVYDNRIIGEGYHQQYGKAHAEVNAIQSVPISQRHLMEHSTLYVSLEPCSHYGKTPPCTNLIIQHKIPRVVIACADPFPKVSGSGIKQLQEAGVQVTVGILEEEAKHLNRRFMTFHTQQSPRVILKWAQTSDLFFAKTSDRQTWISNEFSKTLVHKWRSEEQSIMVGYNTALTDNPQLNVRNWFGSSPMRIVLDEHLTLPKHLCLFDQSIPTLVITGSSQPVQTSYGNLSFFQTPFDETLLPEIMSYLYRHEIQSLMVEGGKYLLDTLISQNLWHEARIFTAPQRWGTGIPAPRLPESAVLLDETMIHTDRLQVWEN